MSDQSNQVESAPRPRLTAHAKFDEQLAALRKRLVREASMATDLLVSSLECLWDLDHDRARTVRMADDAIDAEEVAIEEECLRLLTLERPFGHDMRQLAFCMKVNSDIERVADHGASIAKVCLKIDPPTPVWPTALREMGDRIPVACEQLIRAVINSDIETARQIRAGDKTIDQLDKGAFHEIREQIERDPENAGQGMLMYRASRELERVGDLLGNIAEDIIYLETGTIVRHTKRT
ncbi:MAG: phosphate signaling complex protein PhoU [Phycisphaerales bacterium]